MRLSPWSARFGCQVFLKNSKTLTQPSPSMRASGTNHYQITPYSTRRALQGSPFETNAGCNSRILNPLRAAHPFILEGASARKGVLAQALLLSIAVRMDFCNIYLTPLAKSSPYELAGLVESEVALGIQDASGDRPGPLKTIRKEQTAWTERIG